MNYEQLYKEALERARQVHTTNVDENKKSTEYIFPELKESEDERIRKAIICYIGYGQHCGVSNIDMIAWLEKQGNDSYLQEKIESLTNAHKGEDPEDIIAACRGGEEQGEHKPVNEPKFKVGDWVVTTYGKAKQIISVDKNGDGYTLDDCVYFSGSWCDMYHLWAIEDAKDGDVLYSPCLSLLWIFKSKDTVYCGCNLNYNDGAFCGEGYFERPTDAIPATKEQRDLLFSKMKEAGYEWDAEKKELKKIAKFKVGDTIRLKNSLAEFTIESISDGRYYFKGSSIDIIACDRDYYLAVPKHSNLESIGEKWSEEDTDIEEAIINYWHGDTQDTLLDYLKCLKERVQPKQEWSEEDEQEWKELIEFLEYNGLYDSINFLRYKLKRKQNYE